jgi:hypothetical protein
LPGVLGDINDFGNNLGDAVSHHLGNLPVGLAQLGMHGAAAVSGSQSVGDAAGKLDNYAQQREQQYQASVPTNTASVIGAGIGEALPWLTGAGELRALGAIPEATSLVGKLGHAALEGGAIGAASPVTNGQSFGVEKAKQVGLSALIGGGLPVAGRAVSELAGLGQHVVAPQVIARNNLARLIGSENAVRGPREPEQRGAYGCGSQSGGR